MSIYIYIHMYIYTYIYIYIESFMYICIHAYGPCVRAPPPRHAAASATRQSPPAGHTRESYWYTW